MYSGVGFLENIAQFVGFSHQTYVVILLQERLASSIDVMPVVAHFACDVLSRGRVMFRIPNRGNTTLNLMVVQVSKGQNDCLLREINARCAEFELPEIVFFDAMDLGQMPLKAGKERMLGHG